MACMTAVFDPHPSIPAAASLSPSALASDNALEASRFDRLLGTPLWLVVACGDYVTRARDAVTAARRQGYRVDFLVCDDEQEIGRETAAHADGHRFVITITPPEVDVQTAIRKAAPLAGVICIDTAGTPSLSTALLDVLAKTPRCC